MECLSLPKPIASSIEEIRLLYSYPPSRLNFSSLAVYLDASDILSFSSSEGSFIFSTSSERYFSSETSAGNESSISSYTVFSETSPVSCSRNPRVFPAAIYTSPEEGVIRPDIIFKNIDFPAPLTPTTPILSPSATPSEILSNMTSVPKDNVNSEALSIIKVYFLSLFSCKTQATNHTFA